MEACLALLSTLVNFGLLVVAVLALSFAKAQVKAAREANELASEAQAKASDAQRRAAEQAERDSRAATRPYVYAQVVPGLFGPGSWDLVLRNTGRSPARALTLSTDWPDDLDEISGPLKQFCEEPRDLPPNASLRVTRRASFGQGPWLGQREKATVSVRYSDDQGASHSDSYLCDTAMGSAMPAPSKGPRAAGKDNELKNIEKALRTLNQHVGELRR